MNSTTKASAGHQGAVGRRQGPRARCGASCVICVWVVSMPPSTPAFGTWVVWPWLIGAELGGGQQPEPEPEPSRLGMAVLGIAPRKMATPCCPCGSCGRPDPADPPAANARWLHPGILHMPLLGAVVGAARPAPSVLSAGAQSERGEPSPQVVEMLASQRRRLPKWYLARRCLPEANVTMHSPCGPPRRNGPATFIPSL